MEISTRDYGDIEIGESSIIRFEEGIIGFEEFHAFALLDESGGSSPFRCLQSIEDRDLAFILLDPFSMTPDYRFTLDDDVCEKLSIDGDGDIVILTIVVVPEDVEKMSVNLKAPIIINAVAKKGVQYVVDEGGYSVRQYVLDELERARGAGLCETQTAV